MFGWKFFVECVEKETKCFISCVCTKPLVDENIVILYSHCKVLEKVSESSSKFTAISNKGVFLSKSHESTLKEFLSVS